MALRVTLLALLVLGTAGFAPGSGGTVRDGAIAIQGDHRDALVAELSGRAYTVKRSGG